MMGCYCGKSFIIFSSHLLLLLVLILPIPGPHSDQAGLLYFDLVNSDLTSWISLLALGHSMSDTAFCSDQHFVIC